MPGPPRQPRSPSAEPRLRVPLPAWMQTWPRGVQPVSAYASARGVELVYRAPGQRWFRVVVGLAPGRPRGLDVRAIPGLDAEIAERLAKAVAHHLARVGGSSVRDWLARVASSVAWLSSLAAFGGAGVDAVLDPLLACVDELREAAEPEPDMLARVEAVLHDAGSVLGSDRLAPLTVTAWMAAGTFERALDSWAAAQILASRHDRAALACTAMMRALVGDIAGAHAAAITLAEAGCDAIDARNAGELLERVGRPRLAVDQLQIAAADHGSGSGYDAQRRLAVVARAARQFEIATEAASRMGELAVQREQLLEAARMQRDAGAFLAAEATLARALAETTSEHPSDAITAAITRELATARVWRGDHRGTIELLQPLCERDPADAAALRIRGVAEHLAGRLEPALELLDRALELEPGNDEARLWRARLLQRRGRLAEARLDIRNVTLGDHPVWQLLRALIEEQAAPGYRIDGNTWFIVDQNIRQLLGPDAPVDTKASHEVAIAAIEQALARLGGNFSTRLTTPTTDGSLRWLDDVESPRHRAEQLQFQASHRPVAEILDAFAQLAAAHPDVPFFTTYPAELLLWRGEYELALARFEDVWQATRTRWGYVGAGAAAMLLGQDDRALELWEEGKQHYTYIDAEATYCYRGELLLRRGELERARADLELAIRARPARLGAWVDLGLLELAAGREAPLRAAVERVEQLCAPFVWEARRAAGLAAPCTQLGVESLGALLTTLRSLMRGNRSSVMYTIVADDDVLRVIPVGPPQLWRDYARRALGMQAAELLSALALERGA